MQTIKNIFNQFIKWLRNFSFYKTKALLFTSMISGVFFDAFIKVDLKNLQFEYRNGDTSIVLISAIIVTSIIFLVFDFWYEKVKSKERNDKEILLILKDKSVSKEIKIELLKFLREE